MNDDEAAFIERMAAAATHEIMNGLASIGQATGLMNDLLALGLAGGGFKSLLGLRRKSDRPDTLARFKKSLAKVRSGVDKSLETTQALNRFMHGLSPSNEPVLAGEMLKVIAALMRRAARQKKVELSVGQVEPGVTVTTHPFKIYQALAACVDDLLDKAESGEVFDLSCHLEAERAVLAVRSSAPKPPGEVSEGLRKATLFLSPLNCGLNSIESGHAVTIPRPAP